LEWVSPDLIATLPQTLPTVRYFGMEDRCTTLDQVHTMMARLLNLNSLLLVGGLSGEEPPLGVGNVLKGEFRGVLRLHGRLAHRYVFSMLTSIRTGLHFTEVGIVEADAEFFPDALKLVEACKHSVRRLRFSIQGEAP
jgi:hypothetical protein